MFKKLLIKWAEEILEKFVQAGEGTETFLAVDLGAFNDVMYKWVEAIMKSVAMPIAYVILSLFFVLELHKASLRADGVGGGTPFGVEVVFRAMLKMALCKMAIDSTLLIMRAIYGVSLAVTKGIAGVIKDEAGAVTESVDIAVLKTAIEAMDTGDQIGMLIELVFVRFGILVILGIVHVICIGRFVTIYAHIAISPIPIATIPSEELSSIAKGFLKSFAAVCLQGALIYLILSFFPVLISANILGDKSIFGLLLYSVILVMAIFGSGQLAKGICNAM